MKGYQKFLFELAHTASNILLKYFRKSFYIEKKENEGIVTEADKASENKILKLIFKNFPQSTIITEESGFYKGHNELCWIIDPLDGTSNFAHGLSWFAVSIGLYENDKPLAGIIVQPTTQEYFYAEEKKGAFLNKKRISVSKTKKMDEALLGTGFYYTKGKKLKEEMNAFKSMCEKVLAVRRPGSAALDLAFVACGRYDGFWERGLKPWDKAAGMLLVKEAGGIVTNYKGEKTNIHEIETLATNPYLHRDIQNILSSSLR